MGLREGSTLGRDMRGKEGNPAMKITLTAAEKMTGDDRSLMLALEDSDHSHKLLPR